MSSEKRDRLAIIHDMLQIIRKRQPAKPTQILYQANLSNQMLSEYLSELILKGMAEEREEKGGRRTYSITPKGEAYLRDYSSMKSFMESYGLS